MSELQSHLSRSRDKPQLHPTSAPALIHRVVVVGFPLPSPSPLLSVPFTINDFYNELGLLARGFTQLDFPAAVCQVGPVFKKPVDTKKSPPSDSVDFRKNWSNSVKFGKNRSKSI
jgi:hypothetical protein